MSEQARARRVAAPVAPVSGICVDDRRRSDRRATRSCEPRRTGSIPRWPNSPSTPTRRGRGIGRGAGHRGPGRGRPDARVWAHGDLPAAACGRAAPRAEPVARTSAAAASARPMRNSRNLLCRKVFHSASTAASRTTPSCCGSMPPPSTGIPSRGRGPNANRPSGVRRPGSTRPDCSWRSPLGRAETARIPLDQGAPDAGRRAGHRRGLRGGDRPRRPGPWSRPAADARRPALPA